MNLKQRILRRVVNEQRSKILTALANDPVQSIAELLTAAGLDFIQTGNEFSIDTGREDGVTIKVERN
jgi:hypothetical protein